MTYLISIVLIIMSGFFSGLNLGLMSLSAQELKRKMALGDKQAEKVYAVRRRGNLLLCTLLVGNVAVNAALAIFLGSITTGFLAGLITTALITIFGEITPQAVFSRFALSLGAKTAWLVRIFIIVLFPICWPISWVLDKTLGGEIPAVYSKQELVKIIEEHEDSRASELDEAEERIIKGALTFSDKTVADIMTPRTVVKAFETKDKIDEKLLRKIRSFGLSRFPVYKDDLDRVVGILYANDLLGKRNLGKRVGVVAEKPVHFVEENRKLDDVFSAFIKTRHHLFVVRDEFGSLAGVVTLEDVLEEIIREEIIDEDDKHRDLRRVAKQRVKKEGKEI